MEAIAAQAPQEGQAAKTPTQAVAQVLPTSKFLQNIGIESASMKRIAKAAEVAKRVQELESELVAEKARAVEVRVEMDDLKNQVEERDARKKVEEETARLKNQISEMHGFFRSFFAANSAPSNAPQ
jgi:polyhydroxyalkanoate synthesis regulator phasin